MVINAKYDKTSFNHKSVAIRNKLFAIGGTKTSEVFDSHSNRFSLLKPISIGETILYYGITGVISIRKRLMICLDDMFF